MTRTHARSHPGGFHSSVRAGESDDTHSSGRADALMSSVLAAAPGPGSDVRVRGRDLFKDCSIRAGGEAGFSLSSNCAGLAVSEGFDAPDWVCLLPPLFDQHIGFFLGFFFLSTFGNLKTPDTVLVVHYVSL